MPRAYTRNPELGFIPIAMAAAPMAGKLLGGAGKAIGSLFKKKKKKKPPTAPSPAKAGSPDTGGAASGAQALSGSAGKKASAATSLTKADVAKALTEYHNSQQATKQAHASVTSQVHGKISPQLKEIAKLAKAAAIRDQATAEHNKIMKESARWDASLKGHAQILAKMEQLEKALQDDRSKKLRAFDIYGVHT